MQCQNNLPFNTKKGTLIIQTNSWKVYMLAWYTQEVNLKFKPETRPNDH